MSWQKPFASRDLRSLDAFSLKRLRKVSIRPSTRIPSVLSNRGLAPAKTCNQKYKSQPEVRNSCIYTQISMNNTSAWTDTSACNNSTAASRTPCVVLVNTFSKNVRNKSFEKNNKSAISHFDSRSCSPLHTRIQQKGCGCCSYQICLRERWKNAYLRT